MAVAAVVWSKGEESRREDKNKISKLDVRRSVVFSFRSRTRIITIFDSRVPREKHENILYVPSPVLERQLIIHRVSLDIFF